MASAGANAIPPTSDGEPLARTASFALLPATATIVGVLVLRQVPSVAECAGIALVIAGVALHRAEARR